MGEVVHSSHSAGWMGGEAPAVSIGGLLLVFSQLRRSRPLGVEVLARSQHQQQMRSEPALPATHT